MLAYPAFLLLLLVSSLSLAYGTDPLLLQGVRFGAHDTLARIVFDLQEHTPYRILPGDDPSTILVEFPGVYRLPSKEVWRSRHPLIQEVRFIEGPAKIVAQIRLTQLGNVPKHFLMNAPPRIVIDLSHQPSVASTQPATAVPTIPRAQKIGATPLEGQTTPPAGQSPPSPTVPKPPPKQALNPQPASPTTTSPEQPLSQSQMLQLAEHQWQGRLLEDAQRSYRTFLERFPDYANNHLIAIRLADILYEQHNYRDALEAYAKIIEAYPNSEGALISQIRMAELGAQIPELIPPGQGEYYAPYYHPLQALGQLIQTYPFSPLADVARYKMGLMFLQRDELQAALDTFRELLNKPLKDALHSDVEKEFHKTLERLLAKHQEQGAFLEVIRTFFAHQGLLEPADAAHTDLLLPVALSYARLGLLPEAEQLLQRLLDTASLPQQQAKLALEQAALLFKQGKLQEAKSLLVPLVQSAEAGLRGRIVLLLGQIALQEGRPAEAVRYLSMPKELLDAPAERAFMLALLGKAYAAQGDKEKGLQAFQKCAEVTGEGEPGRPPVAETCLLHAGGLLFERQQLQPALSMYQALLQSFPQTPHRNWVLLRMAAIHGDLADAPQRLGTLETLRDTAKNSLWQKVATESLDEVAWQKRFHELLAEFQNNLIR